MYKIYIVEDDKGIADGITSCLANWGMEGRTVSDFMNVMKEVKEYEPHLIHSKALRPERAHRKS